jgi:hypothetical protein
MFPVVDRLRDQDHGFVRQLAEEGLGHHPFAHAHRIPEIGALLEVLRTDLPAVAQVGNHHAAGIEPDHVRELVVQRGVALENALDPVRIDRLGKSDAVGDRPQQGAFLRDIGIQVGRGRRQQGELLGPYRGAHLALRAVQRQHGDQGARKQDEHYHGRGNAFAQRSKHSDKPSIPQ